MPVTVRPKTELSLAIFNGMGEAGFSISELASKTEVVYETIRKIVSGEQPPSKRLLADICSTLNLDFDLCHEMLIAQKIKAKYGTLPSKMAKKNPKLQPIEDSWSFLSEEEQNHILKLVHLYAHQRRSKTRKKGSS